MSGLVGTLIADIAAAIRTAPSQRLVKVISPCQPTTAFAFLRKETARAVHALPTPS
jgi:hypothetical protein